jgi:hypothetical protein
MGVWAYRRTASSRVHGSSRGGDATPHKNRLKMITKFLILGRSRDEPRHAIRPYASLLVPSRTSRRSSVPLRNNRGLLKQTAGR